MTLHPETFITHSLVVWKPVNERLCPSLKSFPRGRRSGIVPQPAAQSRLLQLPYESTAGLFRRVAAIAPHAPHPTPYSFYSRIHGIVTAIILQPLRPLLARARTCLRGAFGV